MIIISDIERRKPPTRIVYRGAAYYRTGRRADSWTNYMGNRYDGGPEVAYEYEVGEYTSALNGHAILVTYGACALQQFIWTDVDGNVHETWTTEEQWYEENA